MIKKKKKKVAVEISAEAYVNEKQVFAVMESKVGRIEAALIRNLVKSRIREISAHFRKGNKLGGWPLSYNLIRDDIIQDLLKFDLGLYLHAILWEKGLSFEFIDKEDSLGDYCVVKPKKKSKK